MYLRKFFVYFVDFLYYQYRLNRKIVKLSNYHKIARIGSNFCILDHNKLSGENLIIYNNASKDNIIIGENVILECKINCNSNGFIKIGDYTSIRENSVINCNKEITIGNYCFIGNEVLIQDNDSHPEAVSDRKKQSVENMIKGIDTYESKLARIIIEDCVWIGTGAKILKGVKIGKGSIIGAGCVVTREVPEMSLASGNPATVVRKISK